MTPVSATPSPAAWRSERALGDLAEQLHSLVRSGCSDHEAIRDAVQQCSADEGPHDRVRVDLVQLPMSATLQAGGLRSGSVSR